MGMYLSPRQTGLRTSPELSIRALSSLPQHGATISHTWPNFTNPHNDTTNATSKDVTETKREMRSLLDARPANSSQMVDATCHSERTTPMVMTVKRRERASERVCERERESTKKNQQKKRVAEQMSPAILSGSSSYKQGKFHRAWNLHKHLHK